MTTKKTAAKKTAAKKTTAAKLVCGYGDKNPVVASRETPRGPRYLCERHKAQTESMGHETKVVR